MRDHVDIAEGDLALGAYGPGPATFIIGPIVAELFATAIEVLDASGFPFGSPGLP